MHALLTRSARVLAAAALGAVALVAVAVAAGAEGGATETVGDTDRRLVAEVQVGGGSYSVRGDSPWGACTFIQRSSVEVAQELFVGFVNPNHLVGSIEVLLALIEGLEQTGFEFEGELAFWYDVTCPNELLEPGGRAIWPVGDAIPQRVVDALTRQAADNQVLPLFYPHGAPEGSADAPFVTGVETHLWLDQARFQPVQAVAEIPGLMRVTVTGTPQDPLWSAGDGTAPFPCDGPGTPWYDGARGADCGHEYQRSTATSPTGVFTLGVTVRWSITSTCENLATGASCGSQTFPDRVLTSTRPVHVAEIQAIVTDA